MVDKTYFRLSLTPYTQQVMTWTKQHNSSYVPWGYNTLSGSSFLFCRSAIATVLVHVTLAIQETTAKVLTVHQVFHLLLYVAPMLLHAWDWPRYRTPRSGIIDKKLTMTTYLVHLTLREHSSRWMPWQQRWMRPCMYGQGHWVCLHLPQWIYSAEWWTKLWW